MLSVALHLIVLVVFLMKLPALPELPQEEESVAVELVPPPEEEKPAEAPKQEEEKAAEPPPPPPPPPPVEEKKVEEPPPTSEFTPAIQFGEKDSGMNGDLRGNAEEKTDEPVNTPPVEESQKPEAPAATEPEDTAESVEQPADGGAVEGGETEFPTDQALALIAPPPPKPAKPTETKGTAESEVPLVPKPVKRIYSASVSEDLVAMSAMAGESRGERIQRLCGTELKAQLSQVSPPRDLIWAPDLRSRSGNIINLPEAVFGDRNGNWYNLAMRCTIDYDATRVVDFSFAVGVPVPRSEWKKHGIDRYR